MSDEENGQFNVWEHVVKKSNAKKNAVLECKYCERQFKGGATRARQHLEGISAQGGGVAPCSQVPAGVRKRLKELTKAARDDAEQKAKHEAALKAADSRSSKQSTIAACFSKADKEETDCLVADCFYENGISFNVARSPSFKAMVSAIANTGPGYKPPGYEALRTTHLAKAVARTRSKLGAYKATVKLTGGSLTSDGWSNTRNEPLLNMLFVTNKGALFESAVNAGGETKTAEWIAEQLVAAIERVGSADVVAVITDNAANCKGAGAIIEQTYPHISWQPCVAHVLDLLLEDIGKLKWAESVINQGRELVTFIRNHHFSIAAFRKVADQLNLDKELLKPGPTRFATSFIMLERAMEVRRVLEKLMVDDEYIEWAGQSQYKRAAEAVKATVFSATVGQQRGFWDKAEELVTLCTPMVALLRKADSNMPCTGKVYHGMFEIQEHVKTVASMSAAKKKEVEKLIVDRWDQLTTPLILAGYALDPQWLDVNITANAEVTQGLFTMLKRLSPNAQAAEAAERQFMQFRRREGLFAREAAMNNASKMPGDEWWALYGGGVPQLQAVAIKVLAQVASACACERNWSTFDFIHNKRRNKLSAKRAADLVYVFSNKRLATRQEQASKDWLHWDASSDEMEDD